MPTMAQGTPARAPTDTVARPVGKRRAPSAVTAATLAPHAAEIWALVDRSSEHWQWTGPRFSSGQPRFTISGRSGQHLSVPKTLLLLAGQEPLNQERHCRQTCDVPGCVRHWEWIASRDNHGRRRPRLELRPAYTALATTILGEPGTWEDRARCRDVDNPDAFFPEDHRDTEIARRFCRACPVQIDCGTAAVSRGEWHGVWAGMSERQLRETVQAVHGDRAGREAVAA